MEHGRKRFVIPCLLLAWLGIGLGCGNKGKSNISDGHPKAGDTAVSGQSGSGKTGATAERVNDFETADFVV